jgi:hypothetical protein
MKAGTFEKSVKRVLKADDDWFWNAYVQEISRTDIKRKYRTELMLREFDRMRAYI